MSVFISYCHDDISFVDKLAKLLVSKKFHVWLDRWELNIGDSLTDKIQTALTDSSFLLVILSKNSVNSDWCKREINTGLIRELEERRVVILPILIEDCEIPLFLRDKIYADFRKDFDKAFSLLLDALSKVINDSLGRVNGPDYLTDWGIDTGLVDGLFFIKIDSVSFSTEQAWSILTRILIVSNDTGTSRIMEFEKAGLGWFQKHVILEMCAQLGNKRDLRVLLKDSSPVENKINITDPKKGIKFDIVVSARRLGEDNGKDILFDWGSIFGYIRDSILSTKREFTPEEQKALIEIYSKGI